MDLAGLFLKAGVKNQRVTLLLTDAQIPDDRFLVIVNHFLASGQIQNERQLCNYKNDTYLFFFNAPVCYYEFFFSFR